MKGWNGDEQCNQLCHAQSLTLISVCHHGGDEKRLKFTEQENSLADEHIH